MPNTCSGCPAEWGGMNTCHCSGCHETFSGLTAFDKHRRGYRCSTPQKCGLEKGSRGYWGLPGPEDAPWRTANPGMASLGGADGAA